MEESGIEDDGEEIQTDGSNINMNDFVLLCGKVSNIMLLK